MIKKLLGLPFAIYFIILTTSFSAHGELCRNVDLTKTPRVETVSRSVLRTNEVWIESYPDLVKTYREALELLPFSMEVVEGAYQAKAGDSPFLSIVIPAYKEASRLPGSLRKITEFFDLFPFPVEILVRVEKSPDATAELAQEAVTDVPYIRVYPHEVHRGKGYAVKQGMLDAKGRYVLFMDADLSTPLPEVYKFLAHVKSNPEVKVLIGDRHHPDSQIVREQSLKRQVMGRVFRGLSTTVMTRFGLRQIYDTQCGFKLFEAGASQEIFNRVQTDGFAFDIEALLYAQALGYTVKSLPIRWIDDLRTTVHPIIDPIKMLVDTTKIYNRVKADVANHNQTRYPTQYTEEIE